MPEPTIRYLSKLDVLAMYEEIMERFGQESLLRDRGEELLESAMIRPQMAAHYDQASLSKQAALLILGIAQAHPFVDGNKRIAFAAGIVFLQLNGYLVKSQAGEFGKRLVAVLSQNDRESDVVEAFAGWIGANLQAL